MASQATSGGFGEMGGKHLYWRYLVVVLCSWGLLISLSSATRLGASRQKLEVKRHLNRLNKPAVKTIQVFLSTLFMRILLFSSLL